MFYAKSGEMALKLVNEHDFDLILLDIMMPDMNGFDVCAELKNEVKTKKIPVIFLTVKDDEKDIVKGFELGAVDYITKPFDDIELLKAVESRLKKSELLKADYSRDEAGINTFLDEAKSLEELKHLSDSAKVKTYKKKELIYTEGNNPNYLYLLQKKYFY